VTIDAMGCQTAIAEQIIDAKANYMLAVKGNQGNLHRHIEGRFALTDDPRFANRAQPLYTETVDRRGSLTERRQCWVLADTEAAQMGWKACQTIVRVRYERDKAGKKSEGTRYFITSSPPNPQLALTSVRAHWGIENSLHWTLDVVFKEDQARTQNAHAAQNLAVLRRIALNLVRPYKDKMSMKTRRYQAGLDDEFLLRVMQQS
jgi:predicted transposase YbfD/YdcC